ncbi:jg7523 [Pararge aegeria aegeria]|uniref:Jg7523 protein n=1 Tax=Pararge aegeria aegeria TaxID=348720 RepID=A0A8S4REF8_9NEOP|nr:jg7523 [Pararge aegeria aegeria]
MACAGKRSVGRPPTWWTDDIRRAAGSSPAARGPGPWILELPIKDLCPAVDVNDELMKDVLHLAHDFKVILGYICTNILLMPLVDLPYAVSALLWL